MVSLSSIIAGIAALTASASATPTGYDALNSFSIPSFNYALLGRDNTPSLVLDALQTNGIIALSGIPNYANVRQQYLAKAAECALIAADDSEAAFLSKKLFQDGTKRYTISSSAGLELDDESAAATKEKCPGYMELYQEFSHLLEHTVNTFGNTLDLTAFTVSDGHRGISSRKLVSDAMRLDHFHAYEAASTKRMDQAQRELSFSLPLHEDHGLFIAMTAPKFFDVENDNNRRLVERQLAPDASGLAIQLQSGEKVRPILKDDEIVIMMGTGASRWLQTSHRLPAVLHGMKMPESVVGDTTRSLRAWFGKMTLLPSYQRMLSNQNVDFATHANLTTRYLLTSNDNDLKTIGCASGRELEASATTCIRQQCTTKSGATAPDEGCETVCNRSGHSDTDATDCEEKCDCTDVDGTAEICWMLCVSTLDSCDVSEQTCSGQALVCSSSASGTSTSSMDMNSMSSMSSMSGMDMSSESGSDEVTAGSGSDTVPSPTPSSAIKHSIASTTVLILSVAATMLMQVLM